MSFQWLRKDNFFVKTLLATFSAVLLAIPWTWGASFTLFFALVPLLIIEKNSSRKGFLAYSSYAIILWHLLAVLWITKAAVIGIFASTLLNLVLWNIALQAYSYLRQKRGKTLSYVALCSGLICMEYLNLANSEVTWPWLVLGNGFATTHTLVQWYEYTGILGGSLWAILTNIFIFEFYETRRKKPLIIALSIVAVGVISSKIIYHTYSLEGEKIKVGIIQPNFDPYTAKFTMGTRVQVEIVDSMINTLPTNLDYVILPETTFDQQLLEKNIDDHWSIMVMKNRISNRCPDADVIMGSSTSIYYKSDSRPTQTARIIKGHEGHFWDLSNSSLSINPSRDTEVYKKTKLVIGVEMLPFNNILSKIGELSVKLGGTSGALLPQKEATNFTHTKKGIEAGAPICYESIYGEYFSQFVKKGATAMFVISNDGWWDDTYGYKQLFTFAQLRAIETRREIGRSANTGISGIIDARGDVKESLGWWRRGIIVGEMTLNSKKTLYTRYGDYIGTTASYIFILSLLYAIAVHFKKKLTKIV